MTTPISEPLLELSVEERLLRAQRGQIVSSAHGSSIHGADKKILYNQDDWAQVVNPYAKKQAKASN